MKLVIIYKCKDIYEHIVLSTETFYGVKRIEIPDQHMRIFHNAGEEYFLVDDIIEMRVSR